MLSASRRCSRRLHARQSRVHDHRRKGQPLRAPFLSRPARRAAPAEQLLRRQGVPARNPRDRVATLIALGDDPRLLPRSPSSSSTGASKYFQSLNRFRFRFGQNFSVRHVSNPLHSAGSTFADQHAEMKVGPKDRLRYSRGCLSPRNIRNGNVIAIPESGALAHVRENAVALSLTLTRRTFRHWTRLFQDHRRKLVAGVGSHIQVWLEPRQLTPPKPLHSRLRPSG
jgi:hypothetical protein